MINRCLRNCHLFLLFMVVATAKSEDLKAAVVQNIKTLVSKSDYSIIQKLFSLQSLPVLGLAVSILLDLADTEKCRSLKVSAIKCLTELSQVDGKCEYISIWVTLYMCTWMRKQDNICPLYYNPFIQRQVCGDYWHVSEDHMNRAILTKACSFSSSCESNSH